MKVLFIDSGIGGLTTLASCLNRMPNLNFIYFADDKFSPYGSLNSYQITSRLCNIIDSFKNIGAVVLACNTATACSIETLRKHYSMPIIGVEPAIKPASREASKILVLATPATASNPRMLRLCKSANCPLEIVAMPNLARLIDGYFLDGDSFSEEELYKTIAYIKKLSAGCSHIVLGCTHYVHLSGQIEQSTGLKVVNGNNGVANRLYTVLSHQNLLNRPTKITMRLLYRPNKFITSSGDKKLSKKYAKILCQTLAKTQVMC